MPIDNANLCMKGIRRETILCSSEELSKMLYQNSVFQVCHLPAFPFPTVLAFLSSPELLARNAFLALLLASSSLGIY